MPKIEFDEAGRELPDRTPVELPFDAKRPESLKDMVARMLQQHELLRVESEGDETFEEANDFDLDDDDAEIRATHHELHEEVVDEVKRVKAEQAAAAADALRRRVDGAEEGEGGEDEVSEEAAGAASRTRVQGKSGGIKKKGPRRRPEPEEEEEEGGG